MSATSDIETFFSAKANQGGVVVRESPKFDLDLYIADYEDASRFDRLLLIGKTCAPLCIKALKAAVIKAKEEENVDRYKQACSTLRQVAPSEPEATRDNAWIEETERKNEVETQRLEYELNGYKNNLIKESIKMGTEDLGKHLERIGQLSGAIEAYRQMRVGAAVTLDYIYSLMHIIRVALQRHDWSLVLNHVGKISGYEVADGRKELESYTNVVAGIAYLGLNCYEEATRSFLAADSAASQYWEGSVATVRDVALYGGLLALATINRDDIQTQVLEKPRFRVFLEREPTIRKAIGLFVNGRYSQCLKMLESSKADSLLDLYLQKHVSNIFSIIRSKSIIQYFIPYSCVTLDSLDAAFAPKGGTVEKELVQMILDEKLKARIDGKLRLLVAVEPDPRREMQRTAIATAHKFEREAKQRLRRINIVSNGLEIRYKKSDADHIDDLDGDTIMTLAGAPQG